MNDLSAGNGDDRGHRWVTETIFWSSLLLYVERLKGGTSSIVERLTLRFGDELDLFILRRFDNDEWLRLEPDLARHEAAALERAVATGLPTPRLIAFDESGSEAGMPAVLMSHLEGSVELIPDDMPRWIDRMADALARIHRVEPDRFEWRYYTYVDPATLQVPSWSKQSREWRRALEVVTAPAPVTRQTFIHRDYHPGNLLWRNGEIIGVVDWVNACAGPPGIDIGHCRVNLAQLHGVAVADMFLEAYRRHAGSAFEYHPYWDLVSLVDVVDGPPGVYPGWTDCGVTGLTDELMVERLDRYLASLVEQV